MNADAERDPSQAALRELPSVDHLLQQPAIASLLDEYPRAEVVQAVRAVLDGRRTALHAGRPADIGVPSLALAIREELHRRARPHLRRVINATGIVMHTGLGRAPLAEEAVEAVAEVAGGYCNLEIHLDTGRRGDRYDHARGLLCELTGAEDALVVNNNAGGTYLALNTLAAEREVVVSRGQLVEIGGSYRMPDVMAAARCHMIEVGTTNRTHLRDYERAISDQTAGLIRVHTSNYRVQGFVESVPIEALVTLGHERGLWVIDDLGSGVLDLGLPWPDPTDPDAPADEPESMNGPDADLEQVPTADAKDRPLVPDPPALADWDEPSVRASVAAGADLTLFSGDKILGGPQAGIIVGRAELIARLRSNPLTRALRPDKMTLAALEATLRLYRDPAALVRRHPVFRMLSVRPALLEKTAVHLEHAVSRALTDADVISIPGVSEAGGGSLPTLSFPTWTVQVRQPEVASMRLAAALRERELPIICRVQDEALVFDCRTLFPGDIEQIASALAEVVRDLSSE